MFRSDTGVHINIQYSLPQLVLAHGFEFLTGVYIIGIDEFQLPGDGTRSGAVIAGDHLYPDACPFTGLHCCNRFLTRRINQAKQSQHKQVIFHVTEFQFQLFVAYRFDSNCQYSLTLLCHFFNTGQPVIAVQRLITIHGSLPGTHLQYTFRSTFKKNESITGMTVMKRRHKTVL